jgi:hypothetical protein
MIKPKYPEVGVQKVDERKIKTASRPKPTVKQLLDKYTSRKANNVFRRLGCNKHISSPSRHGGHHQRWLGITYDQLHYFPSAPYATRPTGYFQPERIPLEHIYERQLFEKRVRFNHEVIPHGDIVFRGNNKKPISRISNPRRIQNPDGKYYRGGQKLKWVPISREGHDGNEHDGTKGIAAKHTSLNSELADAPAGLYPGSRVEVEADGTTADGYKIGEYPSTEGGVSNPKTIDVDGISGSVQEKAARTEGKHVDNTRIASCSTRPSQKSESARVHADSVMRGRTSGAFENVSSMGFNCNTTQRWDCNRGSHKIKAGSVADHKRVSSAKGRIFAPRAIVHHYRPRYPGGQHY